MFYHSTQRLYQLKMADGENILVGASSSTSNIEEPVSKKPKMGMAIECGLKIVKTEQVTYGPEAGESWATAISALPEKEIEPVLVGQASAAAPGGDNGLLGFEPQERVANLDKASGPTAEPADGVNEDDDRSSHASSSDWTPQPQIGSYSFIQQHIMRETDPRTILKDLLPPETVLPPDLDDMTLWQIIINISEPPKRKKRKDINTLEDVVVPHCPLCPDIPLAIMKPDIVFFGENLPELFHRAMKQDKDEVDLLIVIGSSLKVRPVALIPTSIPHEVPQVLINREQLPHLNFDVELLGDCDVIVNELCHRLGGDFEQLCYNSLRLSEITEKPQRSQTPAEQPPCEALSTHSKPTEEQKRRHTDSSVSASEETDTQMVTETPEGDRVPTEPCPTPQNVTDTAEVYGVPSEPCPKAKIVSDTLEVGVPTEPCPKTQNVTGTKGTLEFDAVPSEPCPKAQIVPETPEVEGAQPEPCPKAQSPNEERMENSDSPSVDTQSEETSGLNDQHVNLEVRRRCWMSRISRSPISKRLETSQYLFQAPNHYIFHGAEVYSNSEDETSSSCGSDSEDSSLEDEDEEDSDAEEDQSTPAEEGEGCLIDIVTHNQACEGTSSVKQMDNTDENVQNTTDL
ncbi:unnamed protein product [Coregonus sp. 'balchen']|nr:unnamed protein product [Coregonus sp. 'balchen']